MTTYKLTDYSPYCESKTSSTGEIMLSEHEIFQSSEISLSCRFGKPLSVMFEEGAKSINFKKVTTIFEVFWNNYKSQFEIFCNHNNRIIKINLQLENDISTIVMYIFKFVINGFNEYTYISMFAYPQLMHHNVFMDLINDFESYKIEFIDEMFSDVGFGSYKCSNLYETFACIDEEPSHYKRIYAHYLLYLIMSKFKVIRKTPLNRTIMKYNDITHEYINCQYTYMHHSKLRIIYEKSNKEIQLDINETKYFSRQELFVIYLTTNQIDKLKKLINKSII